MLNYVSGNGDSLVSSTWTLSPSKGIIQSSTKDKVTIEWNEDGTTLLQVKFITSSGDTFSCIKVIDIMNPHEFEV